MRSPRTSGPRHAAAPSAASRHTARHAVRPGTAPSASRRRATTVSVITAASLSPMILLAPVAAACGASSSSGGSDADYRSSPAVAGVSTSAEGSGSGSSSSGSSASGSSSSGSAGLSRAAARVVDLTNAQRAAKGCSALSVDPRLVEAAQDHSEDQASRGRMSHTGSGGTDFVDRARAAGYSSPGAENVAAGQSSAGEVVEDWMNSSGHRRNILNCGLDTIGVGYADGYWTQVFGR